MASYFSVWMDSRESLLGGKERRGRRGEGKRRRRKMRDEEEKEEGRCARNQVCRKKGRQETVREGEYHLCS